MTAEGAGAGTGVGTGVGVGTGTGAGAGTGARIAAMAAPASRIPSAILSVAALNWSIWACVANVLRLCG
jgi:hypothetical protein